MVFTRSREQRTGTPTDSTTKTLRVLLPINDEEYGQAIVDHVLDHQWPQNADFRLLYVIDWVPSEKEVAASPPLGEYAESKREAAHALLRRFGEQIREKLGKHVEEEIREGHAAEQIIAAAQGWNADQIVMGSHARKGISRFLMGSVSAAVVSHVPCSVTVVRHRKDSD